MTKNSSKRKTRRRMLLLGLSSIIVIFVMTFTIGKYWVEIFEKYQEKKELDKELTLLKFFFLNPLQKISLQFSLTMEYFFL